ncbi:MAG TPA: adenosylmethionine decarboxylase [Desulfurococcales archaeon]|nr:adenosylmethionine decarboxylase [Desulfurococcales archaeon]
MEKVFLPEDTSDRVVGRHVYGNLYGCPKEILSDEDRLRRIVIEAAKIANMTLWDIRSWRFSGSKGGVSVIALVVESHIAIHTWIEYRYATVDVYTCGRNSDPWRAFYYIVSELKPQDYTVHYSDRSSRAINR